MFEALRVKVSFSNRFYQRQGGWLVPTLSCIHRIAGSFLIRSCFVAFWGVFPHPLQLYTPAMSFSGEVKLSKHPLRVGVALGPVPPPIARFLAWT